jgi:hypothetical protein
MYGQDNKWIIKHFLIACSAVSAPLPPNGLLHAGSAAGSVAMHVGKIACIVSRASWDTIDQYSGRFGATLLFGTASSPKGSNL